MRYPISTKQGGNAVGAPDVCLVPGPSGTTPVPFVNTASCADANGTVSKVLAENKEVIVESSTVPSSHGDEAGTAGGCVSGTSRDEMQIQGYSSKVYASGLKVAYHTVQTSHNGSSANAPCGIHASPSGNKVLVAQ